MEIRLGQDANDEGRVIDLSDIARALGTYVIGTTGTGKTTFLNHMILQDITAGHGICVLDPHGDQIDYIIARIPKDRVKDVILFDPADIEHPFGLNLFSCDHTDPRQRDLITSTLMDTLYKLFHYSWGPRMEDLLRHSIQTLLYNGDSTFLELLQLLTNHEKRKQLSQAGSAADPVLRHYWEHQFPENEYVASTDKWRIPREQIDLVSSSLNKIGRFLVNPVVRNIIAQIESTINFREVMDEGRILLVNLSKGDIGSDNSSFLGSVLVNQLLLAALSRRSIPEEQRRPFYLYVDEYQNFATESFPQLQSEARKFRVSTVVAHQYRDQLDDNNRGSTLNVANIVVFRVSGKDAVELAGQFDNTPRELPAQYRPVMGQVGDGVYAQAQTSGSQTTLYEAIVGLRETYSDTHLEMANLLATLPQHQGIVRIMDEKTKGLRQYRIDTEVPQHQVVKSNRRIIRQNSRRMARTRQDVEQEIKQRMYSEVKFETSLENLMNPLDAGA